MDVIVSVDTSIVHLAGSLGVPTIMVQPLMETDFRWGSGEETAWYQSVSIVPNRNNWDEVFAVVRKKLECL
jgi:ADP-heptose:LPS heptosyltransferase